MTVFLSLFVFLGQMGHTMFGLFFLFFCSLGAGSGRTLLLHYTG